jgi:predicted RNase H-like HicB family nuclease
MKQNRYVYPAIFSYNSTDITVEFPDIRGCFTSGNTQEEALEMAKEAMALHLAGLEKNNFDLPAATSLNKLKTEANQATVLVDVRMSSFGKEMNNLSVNAILTSPRWLISPK